MLQHVQTHVEEEVCGLLAGKDAQVEIVRHITNIEHSPSTFRMDPQEQVAALLEFEDRGLDLLGIYHSHPEGPDSLSPQDLQLSTYAQAIFLLWTRLDAGWGCRAFRWAEDRFIKIALEIKERGPTDGA